MVIAICGLRADTVTVTQSRAQPVLSGSLSASIGRKIMFCYLHTVKY